MSARRIACRLLRSISLLSFWCHNCVHPSLRGSASPLGEHRTAPRSTSRRAAGGAAAATSWRLPSPSSPSSAPQTTSRCGQLSLAGQCRCQMLKREHRSLEHLGYSTSTRLVANAMTTAPYLTMQKVHTAAALFPSPTAVCKPRLASCQVLLAMMHERMDCRMFA